MAIAKGRRYSYQEWLELDFGESSRSELIDGEIYMMSPPSRRHQAISRELSGRLFNHLAGKRCKMYTAPFDVRLNDDTVVVPDIVVICDPNKLTKAGCTGTPDIMIEILSPSTERHDRYTKLMLYQRNHVQEYWIVDPENDIITAYRLTEKGYVPTIYTSADIATMDALPGFEINLAEVFTEE